MARGVQSVKVVLGIIVRLDCWNKFCCDDITPHSIHEDGGTTMWQAEGNSWTRVNVPTDLHPACDLLPRLPSQALIVAMKIKNKGHYMDHIFNC